MPLLSDPVLVYAPEGSVELDLLREARIPFTRIPAADGPPTVTWGASQYTRRDDGISRFIAAYRTKVAGSKDRYGVTLPICGEVYVEVEMPADPWAEAEGCGPSSTTPDGRKFHTRQDAIYVLAKEAAAALLGGAPDGPADKISEIKPIVGTLAQRGSNVTRLMTDWEAEADQQAREDLVRRMICDGDIERFITRYDLGLVGRGPGQGRGSNDRLTYILCPFHQEKRASFVFWAAHTTRSGEVHCNCFGCQWEGDLVALVAQLQGVTRQELVEDPVRWGP